MIKKYAPLVSVVIRVFNGEKYIHCAINSVFKQDYQPIEIIVIDDASSDATLEILRDFGHQISVYEQSNKGSAAARNLGIRMAKGDYVAFLDADVQIGVHRAVGGLLRSFRVFGQSLTAGGSGLSFRETMLETLKECPALVLLILSGRDFMGREFLETARSEPEWSAVLARSGLVRCDLTEVDHTFSSAGWPAHLEQVTLN
jgi:hypothetical protein